LHLERRLKRPTFRLTVANQITLAFWVVYVPALVVITAITSAATERWLISSKLNELRVEALLIKKYVDSWHQESTSQLRFFKALDSVALLSQAANHDFAIPCWW
jgi:membrane-bound lytic murein transglycosylase MltF